MKDVIVRYILHGIGGESSVMGCGYYPFYSDQVDCHYPEGGESEIQIAVLEHLDKNLLINLTLVVLQTWYFAWLNIQKEVSDLMVKVDIDMK